MKKIIKYASISCLAVSILLFIYYGFFKINKEKPELGKTLHAPARLVEAGPYGENVRSSEKIGNCTFNMQAKRLYFKKTKVFGFSSALFKKLVAEDLNITIYKNNNKILELHKDKMNTLPDMKCLQIQNPVILYPKTIGQPDKIKIDKKKKLVTLYYGNQTDVWDLDAM